MLPPFLALSLADPEDGFVVRFRSSLLEEVGDSLVPAPVAVNLEVAPKAEREAAQQLTVDSGEAQILLAEEVAANRREGSPPTSELSTGKMNPQAPGWNKKVGEVATLPSIRKSVT